MFREKAGQNWGCRVSTCSKNAIGKPSSMRCRITKRAFSSFRTLFKQELEPLHQSVGYPQERRD